MTIKKQPNNPFSEEDFKKYYVFYNKNPEYPDYQSMFDKVKGQITQVCSDLFTLENNVDANIDKINNPNRPLVKGTITLFEAKSLIIILLSLYSYLGLRYLPPILDPIWTATILLITLYIVI